MISRLYNFWQIIKNNLWFVPGLISLFYLCLTMGVYNLESRYFQEVELPSMLFNGGIEDAKSLTSTLLSSMITMATLAISITMVVLSLAATQLGPRLILIFMADRKTKSFIGLFFGAVIACFVLAMILHDATPQDYTPRLTVTAVFIMCFANLFVLLAFVHHVALSGIADQVINKVAANLNASLERLTVNKEADEGDAGNDPNGDDWPRDFDKKQQHLYFEQSGYVQNINYEELKDIAARNGLYIQIKFKAGHFLVEGEDGVKVYPKNKLDEELSRCIHDCFIIGMTRTSTQDIEYSIRHLVEIGLRAQSPGINDNFTAMSVLDRLSEAMAILFNKSLPPEWIADEEGQVRINAYQSDETDIIFSAFDQMRDNARQKPDILSHMLRKLRVLCRLARTDAQVLGLKMQIAGIQMNLEQMDQQSADIKEMQRLCTTLEEMMGSKKAAA